MNVLTPIRSMYKVSKDGQEEQTSSLWSLTVQERVQSVIVPPTEQTRNCSALSAPSRPVYNKALVYLVGKTQSPINRAQYDKEVAQLAGSPNFVTDFAAAYNRQNLQNMGSSNGLINVTSHHHQYKQSRLHALQPPHNAPNVVRNGMLISSPRSGKPRRCQSRSELLKERRREYHDDALKLGFKDDGKTSLFRRMTDTSIMPVQN